MISIIDWRMSQCEKYGVTFHFNSWAEAEKITAESPDVVIIATGGQPHTEILSNGNELVVSAWDIISGDVKPGTNVLIFDDAGDHAGLQAAEFIARTGAKVEIMTPDRSFAPEVMAMNLVPYMRSLQKLDVTFTVTFRLEYAEKSGNQIRAHVGSDYGGVSKERTVDQIVVNHGTIPLDELYFELKPLSSNLGETSYDQLLAGKPQSVVRNPEGKFQLFRIGDAVAARNTHAAIYDGLRIRTSERARNEASEHGMVERIYLRERYISYGVLDDYRRPRRNLPRLEQAHSPEGPTRLLTAYLYLLAPRVRWTRINQEKN